MNKFFSGVIVAMVIASTLAKIAGLYLQISKVVITNVILCKFKIDSNNRSTILKLTKLKNDSMSCIWKTMLKKDLKK